MKGSGAECKDLVVPMIDCWTKYMGKSANDKIVLQVLEAQACMQSILSDHASEPILPTSVAQKLKGSTIAMLQGTMLLAQSADAQKKLLFNIVPKHHWVYHLALRCHLLNPRKGNTMLDEDFVGKMSNLVASSSAGTPPHAIAGKVMEKYRYGKWLVHRAD